MNTLNPRGEALRSGSHPLKWEGQSPPRWSLHSRPSNGLIKCCGTGFEAFHNRRHLGGKPAAVFLNEPSACSVPSKTLCGVSKARVMLEGQLECLCIPHVHIPGVGIEEGSVRLCWLATLKGLSTGTHQWEFCRKPPTCAHKRPEWRGNWGGKKMQSKAQTPSGPFLPIHGPCGAPTNVHDSVPEDRGLPTRLQPRWPVNIGWGCQRALVNQVPQW